MSIHILIWSEEHLVLHYLIIFVYLSCIFLNCELLRINIERVEHKQLFESKLPLERQCRPDKVVVRNAQQTHSMSVVKTG
jgi:hypothetical protein